MYNDQQDLTTETENTSSKINPPQESFFKELFRFTLIAVCVVLPIRLFIAQPFIVSGASMYPTFETSDYLIVDEISYKFEDPKRGDVIVFKYPEDPSKFFIKRIIGLPGDTVDIDGIKVTITNAEHPNGWELDESYIDYNRNSTTHVTLASDEYFVMGDNRFASSDSRVWGPLKKEFIIGHAFLRLFPISKIGVNPGAFTIESK